MTRSPAPRLGKGMLMAAWVLLLVLLTLGFQQVLDRRHNPNPHPAGRLAPDGSREVVLRRNAQGHYVAGGRIDGVPVTFLVDTGATDVALSERLARRLGLPRLGGIFSQTANGVAAGWQTRLDRVQLGGIEQRGVRATILPGLKPWRQVLLGMSFLRSLELMQRDGTLTLRQRASETTDMKNAASSGVGWVPGTGVSSSPRP